MKILFNLNKSYMNERTYLFDQEEEKLKSILHTYTIQIEEDIIDNNKKKKQDSIQYFVLIITDNYRSC